MARTGTGAVTPSGKTAPVTVAQAPQRQRWARCSVTSRGRGSGTSKTCRQTGRAVTVGVRQRCARSPNRRRGHDPQHGPGSRSAPASFPCGPAGRRLAWRTCRAGLRVRLWVPLFLRRPSLAGGLLLVVLSSAALRSSSAMRSRRVAFSPLERAAFSRTSAVARRNSPWPHSRKALTTVVAKDEGSRRSCRHAEGLVMGGEVLVPARQHHGSSASTAIMAASTARRSPAGKAL